ncbi:glycosyltransferase [Streptomyces sp. CA-288835]|uniref:glycosyltransferase n=1 Tax=Streptomyces sp. CA-288835 TaxID=3240069 RepID=UPI003D8A973B
MAGRLSCRAELQGLVTMEAVAAGKPVVEADSMALPRLVHLGRDGYFFPPGDVRAVDTRLMELLDDPAAKRPGAGWARPAGRSSPTDVPRTLAAFEALYLHAAGHTAATTALPIPTSAMESEHDEYAARSGRR